MSDNASRSIVDVFSINLRTHRQARGLSQEALAALAGVDRTYVSSCERGLRNVSIKTVSALGHALQIPASILLEEGANLEA